MLMPSPHMVEHFNAVINPVAHNAEFFDNRTTVAVHVGEELVRNGRSFGSGWVLYCGNQVIIAMNVAWKLSP